MNNAKKDSNPKDALGIKKVPLHAVPVKPLLEVGLAMMEGGRKYGTHNYRAIGVRMSTYYDAAMRHLMAWWEGEDNDPDSGIPHLVKAMASLFVVRDGILMGNCEDDRPVQYPNGINMAAHNNRAACLILKYPECAKPFTHAHPSLHTIPLNELVKELELDEPQFKAGDKVRIELRKDVTKFLRERCEASNNIGWYNCPMGTNVHEINLRDGGRTIGCYTDELTLMEDN